MSEYLTPDGFKIDTVVLRNQSGVMKQGSQNIYNVLTAAQAGMNKMLNDELWRSNAAELIVDKFNLLKPKMDEQRDTLEKFCEFLDTSADKYEKLAQKAHERAGGVGN